MHNVIIASLDLSQSMQRYNCSLPGMPDRLEEMRGNVSLSCWHHNMTELLHISQENEWSDSYAAFGDNQSVMAFLHWGNCGSWMKLLGAHLEQLVAGDGCLLRYFLVEFGEWKVTHEDAISVGNLIVGLSALSHEEGGDTCSLLAFFSSLQERCLWEPALQNFWSRLKCCVVPWHL